MAGCGHTACYAELGLEVSLLIFLQGSSRGEGWERKPGDGDYVRKIQRIEKQVSIRIGKEHAELCMGRDRREAETETQRRMHTGMDRAGTRPGSKVERNAIPKLDHTQQRHRLCTN